MRAPLPAAALVALALTGCSDSSDGSSEGAPDCSDVWVAGETLPDDYEGCAEDGETGYAVLLTYGDCEITTYDDRFYAALGGEIGEADGTLDQDAGYVALIDACNGDAEDEATE